ncbi:MAG: glycoside hydrolase family 43 protein [Cytophagales bacterium]|nr:glycoside hydrolase family 43 protein [Cytophagales bacterium]
MKQLLTICLALNSILLPAQNKPEALIKTSDIRIRDPFIYADGSTEKYYMYAQMDNRLGFRGREEKPKGVEVYVSSDLENWEPPKTVLLLPKEFWARKMVWAPEMHHYKGKYYMFVTLTSSELLKHLKKPEGQDDWPPFYKRGTQIFVSDSPLGPFESFENKPHTPENWMALDGTLYVEGGAPYMVFCHEWVEIVDGSMDYMRLSSDLSKTEGTPHKMFHASEARWSTGKTNKVTDGCFMYRTKSGKLLMIWSSFGTDGYAIGIAESESGKLKGPWIQQEKLLFQKNGGHGMLFKTFEDKLMLALHQPNGPRGKERLKLFEIIDTGETLKVAK